MYKITVDRAKNRLYVKLDGFMGEEELRDAADMVIAQVKTLRPGFDIINDISEYKPTTPEGVREVERAMKFIVDNGVGHIFRVTASQRIARLQFLRMAYETGTNVVAREVTSFEEAERKLDELVGNSEKI